MWFKDFYQSKAWKRLRVLALRRYGAVCMCCRSIENIQVDHIKARSLFPRLKLKLSNMQILCEECNKKKGQKVLDFRPVPWRLYYCVIKIMRWTIALSIATLAFVHHEYVFAVAQEVFYSPLFQSLIHGVSQGYDWFALEPSQPEKDYFGNCLAGCGDYP